MIEVFQAYAFKYKSRFLPPKTGSNPYNGITRQRFLKVIYLKEFVWSSPSSCRPICQRLLSTTTVHRWLQPRFCAEGTSYELGYAEIRIIFSNVVTVSQYVEKI